MIRFFVVRIQTLKLLNFRPVPKKVQNCLEKNSFLRLVSRRSEYFRLWIASSGRNAKCQLEP